MGKSFELRFRSVSYWGHQYKSLRLGIQSSQTKKLRHLIDELLQRIFPHSLAQCVTVPTRFMSFTLVYYTDSKQPHIDFQILTVGNNFGASVVDFCTGFAFHAKVTLARNKNFG